MRQESVHGEGASVGAPQRLARASDTSQADSQVRFPVVALPKGGGAVRGIGEKFAANPGTATLTVPIVLSPRRSGLEPKFSMSYEPGACKGPFGFGWSLSLPSITRKTDKGLPLYLDSTESDMFVPSGAEDLVPVASNEPDPPGCRVRSYRPRTDELFARIDRWTRADGDDHWRWLSRDNVLTLRGLESQSRIKHPADPTRIFSVLICESRDDKGDAILYEYKPENGAKIDAAADHKRNRGPADGPLRGANRHLKGIRYGNRVPLLDDAGHRPRMLDDVPQPRREDPRWIFEVVFNYGETNLAPPTPVEINEWDNRADAFSSYRSGFELRTARRCRRILMRHHFPGEPELGADCLVKSTGCDYGQFADDHPDADNPIYGFLRSVTQSGYRRLCNGYLQRDLPPLEFGYSRPTVQDRVDEIAPESLPHLPIGDDGRLCQWVDLHREGIPGIRAEQAEAWLCKCNLSLLHARRVALAPIEIVALRPNATLASEARFMDLACDGPPDLVVLDGWTPGFHEQDAAEGWGPGPFQPFQSRRNRDLRDPNLRFVDLDIDGRHVLIHFKVC